MTQFEITSRWTGEILFTLATDSLQLCIEAAVKRGADLRGADLRGAALRGADLRGADLRGADLHAADLRGADLHGADLHGANLRGADLHAADLRGAQGINKYRTTPLLMLLDQPGLIRAYKLVSSVSVGPYNGGIRYIVGQTYEEPNADTDELNPCGAGINLATLDWCVREWKPGYKILVAEFAAQDIAAIPTATDGKFRVRRCTIVGEKTLTELGLMP